MTAGQRKALRITGWTLLGLLLLGAIGGGYAYSKREELLRYALEKGTRKAQQEYQLDLKIGSARFTGLSTVAFTDITIVPQERDSLARLNRVEVGVRLWPLLLGRIALSDLTLENGMLQVVRRDTLTNIDFILRRKKRDSTAVSRRVDLANVAENLIDELLSKIPNNLSVKNLDLRLIDSSKDTTQRMSLLTEQALIDDQVVSSTLRLNGDEATWHLSGTADPADREYDLALYADGKPLELKYLETRYNLKLQADTLRAELKDVDRFGREFRLEGTGSVRNLRINHPAIARTDVLVDRAALDATVFVGENYLGVDSSSVVHLGQVSARPFVKYTLGEKDKSGKAAKIYEVQLHSDMMNAQALFNSFPQGLFESLEGMKVTGGLKYDLAFRLDEAQPDSVQFNSGLTPQNFRILQMGRVNLAKINSPFVYTPYEKEKPVRDIVIGPQNPDFTPLADIAPDLRNAVLTSEDYSFMTHKGFNEKAFRVSIATNFKEKKFKRGASTVSMQLVKNVYLNRNKTLSRKVEEILIVWLIENGRLVPKNRMYEVYLNLIEWGRDIYGIGEAARYYFGKTPAQLDLGESIFLAFVIPSPKRALNWFNPDGSLQVRNVRGYFRLIGRIMAKRGLTQPDSGAYGFYSVRLREGLRRQVPVTDSLRVDSLMTDPEDEGGGIDDFFKRLFNGNRDKDADEPDNSVQPQTERTGNNPAAVSPADTVKTRRQLRQERRERKRREREAASGSDNA